MANYSQMTTRRNHQRYEKGVKLSYGMSRPFASLPRCSARRRGGEPRFGYTIVFEPDFFIAPPGGIAKVRRPKTDPVMGSGGTLLSAWRTKPRGGG
ncbi:MULTISPECIES: hypothetical protein [unclassified Bradyrhizobium]|jgi:hypothetical protein|uniref:hypothetical protein n=1 Tax=unclassified Bradyrhizobium TaxID=2631580 RepID=UPI00040CE58E|nr:MULTISPECIES: hypothetical protein [unclassified Bradyrhizobium]